MKSLLRFPIVLRGQGMVICAYSIAEVLKESGSVCFGLDGAKAFIYLVPTNRNQDCSRWAIDHLG